MKRILMLAFFAYLVALPARAELPIDPLHSAMWQTLATRFFGEAVVVFDERVKVNVPSITENQAQVPVTADARAISDVVKMIVFADLNPIQHVLTLTPAKAAPYISFRMKVEQATPVRAAALTSDGVWHVGGVYLNAAGGGCSVPAAERGDVSWTDTLGQTQAKLWRDVDGMTRARFRVRHPMDTGLAKDNTPSYFIERMDMRGTSGEPLATLEMFEPVSEDPTLTLLLRLPPADATLEIEGHDNNGGQYKSSVPAPGRRSALPPAGQTGPV
jgi:sulfur-oxidizing protein SoxY